LKWTEGDQFFQILWKKIEGVVDGNSGYIRFSEHFSESTGSEVTENVPVRV
jgi:hypothetical protein